MVVPTTTSPSLVASVTTPLPQPLLLLLSITTVTVALHLSKKGGEIFSINTSISAVPKLMRSKVLRPTPSAPTKGRSRSVSSPTMLSTPSLLLLERALWLTIGASLSVSALYIPRKNITYSYFRLVSEDRMSKKIIIGEPGIFLRINNVVIFVC